MRNKLSQSTVEKIGYYVYLLSDPRTEKVFYVGKGRGNRVNHHLLGALESDTKETEKIKTIREIERAGLEVGHIVLRHGLTEKEAFEVECAVIDLYGIENLTNLVLGHYSSTRGKMSAKDIEIEYQAQDALFDEPVLLITINKFYSHGMPATALYDATRKHWKLGSRAKSIRIVCAVYRGIIREVYVVDQWFPSDVIPGRSYFEGSVAPDEIRTRYLHTSVKKYAKHGSQNPIKYMK